MTETRRILPGSFEPFVSFAKLIQADAGESEVAKECAGMVLVLADEVATLRAQLAGVREALQGLVDDELCRFDHHGYCQTHGVNNPCEMQVARDVLAALDGAK